jgi:hypothetical protein
MLTARSGRFSPALLFADAEAQAQAPATADVQTQPVQPLTRPLTLVPTPTGRPKIEVRGRLDSRSIRPRFGFARAA